MRIIPPRMMNYAMIFKIIQIHLYRGSSTGSLLYCRDWTRCTTDVHTSNRRETNISSTMGVRRSGTICLDNNASEAEEITDPKESSEKIERQLTPRKDQQ